jgi:hypothetical protein
MAKREYEIRGTVLRVLVGIDPNSKASTAMPAIYALHARGIKDDRHERIRVVDSREQDLLGFGIAKGLEIANHRQFSAVSVEELHEIATRLNLPQPIPHGCLGENLVLKGIPRLSELPPGTLLFFEGADKTRRTAVLAVWDENEPCKIPGEIIQQLFPAIRGISSRFPKAAINKRGVVGTVYCSGHIYDGDIVIAKIPRQKIY